MEHFRKNTGIRTGYLTYSIIPGEIPFPNLCNGVIRTRFTDYLGKAGSVHKESYPSEPLLLPACVASLWYAWVGRSLWSRLLQDQQLPLCRHLGLESTLKVTYPNLCMLLSSVPPPITYTCCVPSGFESSFILSHAQIAQMSVKLSLPLRPFSFVFPISHPTISLPV